MVIFDKKEPLLLFLGDIVIFILSLWVALFIRNGAIPTWDIFQNILFPFSLIFILWALVFFIAGLYDKHKSILKEKIPSTIFNAQLANTLIAIIFFYLIPYFGITPKTILFIDLIITFILIYIWRIYSHKLFSLKNKEAAIIVGAGAEMKELEKEVNENSRLGLRFVSSIDMEKVSGIDFADEITQRVYAENISVIVADLKDDRIEPILPHLYNLIFSGVRFMDMDKVYEDVFDCIPLSLLRYNWFLENISFTQQKTYDILKRIMDFIIGIIGGILSLIFYPFVILAIKLDDGGPIFIFQERVGQNGALIRAYKFRSMSRNETDLSKGITNNKITRVGGFLRKSRIDELPQIWAVVAGSLSLIGPRPELPSGVALYEKEIPYYGIRHLIKPGLSGWAQLYALHGHHGMAMEETIDKLSYDLYYLKNRSFLLDIKIALKTIKKLLSIAGA